jgi:hypothetical protein
VWHVTYDCNHSFIILATVNAIVNYDHKTFIIQATGVLNKDPIVWPDGARTTSLVLLVLPLPQNEFNLTIS